MVTGTLLACGFAFAVSLPYAWDITRFRFDLMAAQLNKITAGSVFSFFFYMYRALSRVAAPLGSLESFGNGLRIVLWVVSAMLILRQARRFMVTVKPELEGLIRLSSWILFVVIFIGSTQFYSWYIGMLFPLALLLSEADALRRFVVLLSATHVLSLTSLSRKEMDTSSRLREPLLVGFYFQIAIKWRLHKSTMQVGNWRFQDLHLGKRRVPTAFPT